MCTKADAKIKTTLVTLPMKYASITDKLSIAKPRRRKSISPFLSQSVLQPMVRF